MDDVFKIEENNGRYYVVAKLPNGMIVTERIPSHVMRMKPDDQEFHFKSVAEGLRRKAWNCGQANTQPTD